MSILSTQEGKGTVAVEKQTAKIPSIVYLAAGMIPLVASMCLMRKRPHTAFMLGQWSAPVLIMGLYNKLVKTEGHD